MSGPADNPRQPHQSNALEPENERGLTPPERAKELLISGQTPEEVRQLLRHEFSMTKHAATKLVATVIGEIHADNPLLRCTFEGNLSLLIERLTLIYQRALAANDFKEARGALMDLAAAQGVVRPKGTIFLSVATPVSAEDDPRPARPKMTDEELVATLRKQGLPIPSRLLGQAKETVVVEREERAGGEERSIEGEGEDATD